jgi:hypothetical protein
MFAAVNIQENISCRICSYSYGLPPYVISQASYNGSIVRISTQRQIYTYISLRKAAVSLYAIHTTVPQEKLRIFLSSIHSPALAAWLSWCHNSRAASSGTTSKQVLWKSVALGSKDGRDNTIRLYFIIKLGKCAKILYTTLFSSNKQFMSCEYLPSMLNFEQVNSVRRSPGFTLTSYWQHQSGEYANILSRKILNYIRYICKILQNEHQ